MGDTTPWSSFTHQALFVIYTREGWQQRPTTFVDWHVTWPIAGNM